MTNIVKYVIIKYKEIEIYSKGGELIKLYIEQGAYLKALSGQTCFFIKSITCLKLSVDKIV